MKHKKYVTNRRTGFTVLATLMALSFCVVVPDAQGANIIVVRRDSQEAEIDAMIAFLESQGHVITEGEYSAAPPDETTLAANDVIIHSRSANSGDYNQAGEATAWNAIDLPFIMMTPYQMRTSRMGWVSGTAFTADVSLTDFDAYPNSSHPFLAGVTGTQIMTSAYTFDYTNTTDSLPDGSTVVATMNGGAGYAIFDIPAGATLFANSDGATPGVAVNRRIHYNPGDESGTNAWTADAFKILENIIEAVTSTNKAHTPDPASGATLVPVDSTILSWQAPDDPNDEVVTYDVYFGTTVPDSNCDGPALVAADQSDTTYDPGALAFNTDYYWRVDVRDPNGGDTPIIVKGDCWAFKTAPATPQITAEPVSQTVGKGTEATFTVGQVNGETFQWKKNGVNLTNGGKISGADTDTLVISNVQVAEEASYSVIISNGSGSATSADAELLTCRLIGHWKLDGNLLDSVQTTEDLPGSGTPSGTAPTHDGSLIGTSDYPVTYVAGKDGQAYDFFGEPNNNVVVIADSADDFNFFPRGMTVSAWVRDDTAGGGTDSTFDGMVSKQRVCCNTTDPNVGTSSGWTLDIRNDDQGEINFRTGGSPQGGSANIARDGEWHMLTGVFDADAGTLALYHDGVFAAQDTASGAVPNIAPVIFGAEEILDGVDSDSASSPTPTDGELDDVRIYSCPLTATQVALLYTDVAGGYICVDEAGELDGFDHNSDCIVNLLDYAQWVANFLNCNRIPTSECN